jgi:DNA anti-recombination protein RmuC
LEKQPIIERLIELDTKAAEMTERRKKQLTDLESQYKEEEEKILKDYAIQIRDETRKTTQKILQEGQQEVSKLKMDTKEILEDMEQKFEKSQKNITDEILKQIFNIKKETHG